MNAQIKPNFDAQRTALVDIIPLPSPFTIVIEITRLCNFRCFYCIHSTKDDSEGAYQKSRLSTDHMEKDLFEKIVRDIMELSVLPKRILLQGLGEPLLYPGLPALIKKIRQSGYEGRVDLVTNGSLMTHEMADELVAAGVSKIIISLQGLSGEDYLSVCKYPLNHEVFIERLRYLYTHRGDTHVYIKIIDSMLKSKEDEERFFTLYGNFCDSIYVEHLVVNQIQMGDIDGHAVEKEKNIFQLPALPREVCPVIFYQLQIFLDGTVLACPVSDIPPQELTIGDVRLESLQDIWNGEKRNNLLINMLSNKRRSMETCRSCQMVHCISDEKESLDECAEQILDRLEK